MIPNGSHLTLSPVYPFSTRHNVTYRSRHVEFCKFTDRNPFGPSLSDRRQIRKFCPLADGAHQAAARPRSHLEHVLRRPHGLAPI